MPNPHQLKVGAELILTGICIAIAGAAVFFFTDCANLPAGFLDFRLCFHPYADHGILFMMLGVVILLEGVRFRIK